MTTAVFTKAGFLLTTHTRRLAKEGRWWEERKKGKERKGKERKGGSERRTKIQVQGYHLNYVGL
jgi:hypothetical protein